MLKKKKKTFKSLQTNVAIIYIFYIVFFFLNIFYIGKSVRASTAMIYLALYLHM